MTFVLPSLFLSIYSGLIPCFHPGMVIDEPFARKGSPAFVLNQCWSDMLLRAMTLARDVDSPAPSGRPSH